MSSSGPMTTAPSHRGSRCTFSKRRQRLSFPCQLQASNTVTRYACKNKIFQKKKSNFFSINGWVLSAGYEHRIRWPGMHVKTKLEKGKKKEKENNLTSTHTHTQGAQTFASVMNTHTHTHKHTHTTRGTRGTPDICNGDEPALCCQCVANVLLMCC